MSARAVPARAVPRPFAIVCALALLLLAAAPAGAATAPEFDRAIGGFPAGPVDVCGTTCAPGEPGSGAAQISNANSLDVGEGEVFVADSSNNRITVFATDGTFRRAFGKDVGGAGTDICTETCEPGVAGGAAGQLSGPYDVEVVGDQLYVADLANRRISVFEKDGTFVRAFGTDVGPDGADTCTTTCQRGVRRAEGMEPLGLAVSGDSVYISENSQHRISVYGTDGTFERSFGRDVGGPGIDLCVARPCASGTEGSGSGQLSQPWDVDVSGAEVFVSEFGNNRISVFTTAGTFQRTFGSQGSGAGQLNAPYGVKVVDGQVLVGDVSNNRVTIFATDGTFDRALGQNVDGNGGDSCTSTCQVGETERLDWPGGVAVDDGEVYVLDQHNYRVTVLASDGSLARGFGKAVGTGPAPCTGENGCPDLFGSGAAGALNFPFGAASDDGYLYVADHFNHRVTVYTTGGRFVRAFGRDVGGFGQDTCTTTCQTGTSGDAAGQLNYPAGITVSGGKVYVAENANNRISVFTPEGTFLRAFGTGVGGPGANVCTQTCTAGGSGSGAGELNYPFNVASGGGEIYVADQGNHRVSVFDEDGEFVRAFGKDVGGPGTDTCTASCQAGTDADGGPAGELSIPTAISVAGSEVFVADLGNRRIAVYTPDGTFQRAFGLGVGGEGVDVCETDCQSGVGNYDAGDIGSPNGLAVADGKVYVSDQYSYRVSVFTTAGEFELAFGKDVGGAGVNVCTTTCTYGTAYSDEPGALDQPAGLTVSDGELFVVEQNSHRVSVFTLPVATLTAAPETLAFGSQDIEDGPSTTQTSTVTNPGSVTVTLDAVTLGGDDDDQFELLGGDPEDCADGLELAADDTCTVRVRFDPSTTGDKVAAVTVSSNAPTVTIDLSGSGTEADTDADGTPDSADLDDDNDTVADSADAFPLDPTEDTDTDDDGTGNNADTDDDGDNAADDDDEFPLDAGESVDTDGDGTGDNADTDADDDGTPDTTDAFPLDDGEDTDTDDDGTGNNADTDDDNDNVADDDDAFPLNAGESVDTDNDGTGDNADTDDDNDNVADDDDAFPRNASEDTDTDGDGTGDNADTDADDDGTPDTTDAFPLDDEETTDTDGDGTGDNADSDDDGDNVADSADDFPLDDEESVDTDDDGTGNNADTDDDNDSVADDDDAFPLNAGESVDTDGDGTGDNADTDADDDGTPDTTDAFPLDDEEDTDTDGDGTGNNADTDDDGDSIADGADKFPLDPAEDTDTDDDGIGNNTDTDDDDDGTDDDEDAFPTNANETTDTDGDGTGNNADTDDDGDNVADSADDFPLDDEESVDTDSDGTGNNADTDDDGDNVADSADDFPLDDEESVDTDGDGTGNNADTDDDNDNVGDGQDDLPLDGGESVDTDDDGTGNNADTDDDNDGTPDSQDRYPLDPDRDGISDGGSSGGGGGGGSSDGGSQDEQPAPGPAPAPAGGGTPGGPGAPGAPRAIEPSALTPVAAALAQTRQEPPALTRTRRGSMLLDTGHLVRCPAGAVRCEVKASLKIVRRSGGDTETTYLADALRATLAPGAGRTIRFTLNAEAEEILARRDSFTASMRLRLERGADVDAQVAGVKIGPLG